MSGAVVGVDVGGTFTDLILMEPESGAVRLAKVPSTPENQAAGVLAALEGADAALAEVAAIVHGTTVTTNALLERKLSRCGLITTRGFRDVLELGRRTRPNAYGLIGSFTPLIPRERRIEVPERMDAAGIGRAAGCPNLITYDTGGTSADVGLVLEGVPAVTAEMELEHGMPIHVPMVDVHTVGAGGGSIARIDEAGLLQVGPESAGAQPGPICYGRGGERPTLTDANLILGRLDPEGLLAVDAPVAPDEVRAVFAAEIGAPLGLDADATAAAVIRIANDRMAGAIRMASLARGHDPRDFVLFAFGGAGPMHAAALAGELGIPRVMIPARPGITSAVGCITADIRHDYVNTVNAPLAEVDMGTVRAILERQAGDGRATIAREEVAVGEVACLHTADMQFEGQTHLLTVPVEGPEVTREALQRAFEAAYWERFSVALDTIRPVLVNLHTAVIGARPAVPLAALAGAGRAASLDGALAGARRAWFPAGWQETPVYDRDRLPAGVRFEDPAIVQQSDCTSVVEPGNRASLDAIGNLILEVAR